MLPPMKKYLISPPPETPSVTQNRVPWSSSRLAKDTLRLLKHKNMLLNVRSNRTILYDRNDRFLATRSEKIPSVTTSSASKPIDSELKPTTPHAPLRALLKNSRFLVSWSSLRLSEDPAEAYNACRNALFQRRKRGTRRWLNCPYPRHKIRFQMQNYQMPFARIPDALCKEQHSTLWLFF